MLDSQDSGDQLKVLPLNGPTEGNNDISKAPENPYGMQLETGQGKRLKDV